MKAKFEIAKKYPFQNEIFCRLNFLWQCLSLVKAKILTLPDGIKFANGICKMFGHSNKEIAIR